ncbi:serine/threonine-protein kinase STY17 [Amborella trichopoda]|uniref:serine/threonine-protein kinase STY17 n=1 Tax=Amborella trichopoda TaxID=13333 RepID=UPI0009C028AF|nr:serine/threonine-protein kinase STY17 [Amborella trichopoda]|eukprot:XP_020526117.1 serine/threonine-protein kinase STY17 [Amborella trichopoda]
MAELGAHICHFGPEEDLNRLQCHASNSKKITPIKLHLNICKMLMQIELHEKVGQGSTAEIHRGTWRGLDVAVKCIDPGLFHRQPEAVNWFVQELETLQRQRHPFVLHVMGACLNPPNNAWVVTELLSGKTLMEWLHGHKERRSTRDIPLPPLRERIRVGMEVAQAMRYLHEQTPKVVHRDLKTSNVCLDDYGHVRVADFGHARFLPEGEHALTGETGTRFCGSLKRVVDVPLCTYVYMAPEVIRCEPYNEKCDVFSFAIILNELITGQQPYIDSTYCPTKIALEVSEGNLRPTLPEDDGTLGELIKLICHAWDEDASRRPSFAIITCLLRRVQLQLTETIYPILSVPE